MKPVSIAAIASAECGRGSVIAGPAYMLAPKPERTHPPMKTIEERVVEIEQRLDRLEARPSLLSLLSPFDGGGDRGPELVVPRSGDVIPRDRIRELARDGAREAIIQYPAAKS